MKQTKRELIGIFLDTFLFQNIVLIQAIGLCPIILAGVNLKQGLALAVCTIAVLLPASLLMSALGEKIPPLLRAPLYTLWAALLMTGASYLLNRFVSTELYAALYLFLPLMAVNSIITYRAGGFAVRNRPLPAVVDALGSGLGFGVVIGVVSALREVIISGTLWDVPIGVPFRLPQAALPFMGFLMLGLMAAFVQWVKTTSGALKARRMGEEAETK